MAPYASLAEARAEGITEAQADDTRLNALLARASRYIDDLTGWWFEPRAFTWTTDGLGTELLHLPAPPITLASVSVDGDALDLADVIVYGLPTDDLAHRQNPKLARRSGVRWPRGRRNVVVTGSFGYVRSDGTSPPDEIKDACLRLVFRMLPRLGDAAGQAARRAHEIVKETTDGHSYELGSAQSGEAGAWRRSGVTGDPDLDLVLLRFRRPPSGGLA